MKIKLKRDWMGHSKGSTITVANSMAMRLEHMGTATAIKEKPAPAKQEPKKAEPKKAEPKKEVSQEPEILEESDEAVFETDDDEE